MCWRIGGSSDYRGMYKQDLGVLQHVLWLHGLNKFGRMEEQSPLFIGLNILVESFHVYDERCHIPTYSKLENEKE